MQCPKCANSTLKTAKVSKADIELERCTTCKGLWFDKDELTSILGQRAERNFDIPKFASRNPRNQCPKCRQALYEFCYPDTLTLVDACKSCRGIWLDDLEWKQINEERSPANQMTFPKCSKQQKKADSCVHCGIVIEKYLAVETAVAEQDQRHRLLEVYPAALTT